MKYDTLKQLRDAVKGGEVTDVVLWIDNDETYVDTDPDDTTAGGIVFAMHPDDLLEQALDLLGIPHEHV